MIFANSYIDVDKTAASGQCFRWKKTEDGAWHVPVCGYVADIRRIDDDHVEVLSDYTNEAFWRTYLDLDRDYEAIFRQLVCESNDVILTQAYQFAHGVVVLNQPFFEVCISSIISQNNNIPRIKKAIEGICLHTGGVFPDARALRDILIRSDLRLGYRQPYLFEFCQRFVQGELRHMEALSPLHAAMKDGLACERPPLTDILGELQTYKGIGPKVAACIALFSLDYINCVPRDVWIKRAEDQYGVSWDAEFAGFQQQLIFYWQQATKTA